MLLPHRPLRTAALAVAISAGVWSAQPPVRAEGDECSSPPGCCAVTTNCGSPFQWRCCEPVGSEAPCDNEPCPNYCIQGTGCPA
jgi:hypothetical protein